MKRMIISAALLFSLTNSLYSQETDLKPFRIMVGVTGGVSELRYDAINRQLARHTYLGELKKEDHPYGLEGIVVYKNRMIFNTSVLLFSKHTLERESTLKKEVSFQRLTVLGKIGVIPFSDKQNLLFPYLGLASETMKAKADFPYYIKSPDALFHSGHNKYLNNNLSILYGLEYTRLPRNRIGVGFGIEIGGNIALTDNLWYIVDEGHFYGRLFHVQFDPGGFFARFHIYILLF